MRWSDRIPLFIVALTSVLMLANAVFGAEVTAGARAEAFFVCLTEDSVLSIQNAAVSSNEKASAMMLEKQNKEECARTPWPLEVVLKEMLYESVDWDGERSQTWRVRPVNGDRDLYTWFFPGRGNI